jgi:hypothetical protein
MYLATMLTDAGSGEDLHMRYMRVWCRVNGEDYDDLMSCDEGPSDDDDEDMTQTFLALMETTNRRATTAITPTSAS